MEQEKQTFRKLCEHYQENYTVSFEIVLQEHLSYFITDFRQFQFRYLPHGQTP
jgi:hypothetical protein